MSQRSAQDFVDALNVQLMPQLGYRLVRNGPLSSWEWQQPPRLIAPAERIPANEFTRSQEK